MWYAFNYNPNNREKTKEEVVLARYECDNKRRIINRFGFFFFANIGSELQSNLADVRKIQQYTFENFRSDT